MPDEGQYSSLNNTGYPQNYLGSVIQSPKINAAGEPTQRSIKDASMARDIVKTVIMAGRNRSIVNSRILAKYNAERPYDAYKLEAEGLGWRSNFTSKPLPAMIEKVAPRFVAAVQGLKYFTNSTLPASFVNSTEKSEKFQSIITKTIRNHKGFVTLLEDIAFDNALFGHTIVAAVDDYDWFPKHFKQDESFVSDGTKSDVRWAQIVVLKEVYLPHELFRQIKDREAAKDAGWNLETTIDAINRASPQQIRDRLNVGGTLETWYQNALRELTIGASYMAGNSVIVVYSLFAREVTGKVSHYRLSGPEMAEIFTRDDRFPSMEDFLAFYSFQKGNGTLHGSKGIGRDIYELAGMLDRTRNEVVDRLIMSGKVIVQGDIKRLHTFKMSVVGSTVLVPNGWQFLEQKLDGNVDGFLKLDAYFTQIVNQLIGSTSVPQVEGEAFRSPQAWAVLAQREEEGQDVRITRFLEQFCNMVFIMQRRLCDPEVDDAAAKECRDELSEFLTKEEIDTLAKQPVASTVRDLTPYQRQLIASIAAEKKGNPLYNQRKLEVEDLTAKAGADFAERVLLPDADPTEHAEQDRQQQLEITLLGHGQPVPVSPRDNHQIHLGVLMPVAEQLAGQIGQGQMPTAALEATAAHINEHFQQATSQGMKPGTMPEVEEFLKKIGPVIAQLKQLDAAAEGHAQAVQTHIAGGAAPPALPAQPPTQDGNPGTTQ
jgi:hypothetical protein